MWSWRKRRKQQRMQHSINHNNNQHERLEEETENEYRGLNNELLCANSHTCHVK